MRKSVAKALCSAVVRSGLLLVLCTVCAAGASSQVPDIAREVESLKAVCANCHDLEIVMDTPRSYEAWHDTVQAMVDRGASGSDEQFEDIMDYLHRTITTMDVNSADLHELKIVLDIPEEVAQAIIARRKSKKFTDLADLKSIRGVDSSKLDSKARLIFFK